MLALALCVLLGSSGCYAPLAAPATPASRLPDSFRMPVRSRMTMYRNWATLSAPPTIYRLGPGDVLDVTPPAVNPIDVVAMRVEVTETGHVHLPEVGAVDLSGATLNEAHLRVNAAYADGIFPQANVSIALVQKATVAVLVLGAVNQPGVHRLPRGENDVAHAIAVAGGTTDDAGDIVQVHHGAQTATAVPAGALPPTINPQQQQQRPNRRGRNRQGQVPQRYDVRPVAHYELLGPEPLGGAAALPGLPTGAVRQAAPAPLSQQPTPQSADSPEHALPAPITPPISTWAAPNQSSTNSRPPAAPVSGNLPQRNATQPMPGPAPTIPAPTIAAPTTAPAAQPVPSPPQVQMLPSPNGNPAPVNPPRVVCIPLRGLSFPPTHPKEVVLQPGDIVMVPPRRREVFYVVGKLNPQAVTRFGLDFREREVGSGFLLPRDRDIDVVTAVAMAGYIDPIDSPTTVTVHRTKPDGTPMLIKVDLIKARYERRENLFVQPGDIIYLNPDPAWWVRRTFNNVVGQLIINTFQQRILP